MIRRVVLLLSAAAVVAAAFLVPMPLVEYSPGYSLSLPPVLAVDADTTPIEGDLGMLVVYVKQPSLVETVRSRILDEYTLRERSRVIPDEENQREYFARQRENFRIAFDIAAAVGQRAAGYEVALVTAVEIAQVLPGGPADGVLELGDRVTAIDGQPVSSAEDLIERLSDLSEGEQVNLTVVRGERRDDVTVTAGMVPELGRPGLGVGVATVEIDVDPAIDVTLTDQNGIGGTSAGMMLALTVYDLLAEEDLAAGRVVLGTGTINADGGVGPIGALRQKVATAIEQGADILLVPAVQGQEAIGYADGAITVIPVATFDEALAALREN